ncbi:MAG: hypothetical protein PVSMB9_06360 [Candidatus Dormibacteria bacterium]
MEPSLAAFAISAGLAVALLLAVPPVGLVALVVLPVAYLVAPRWRSTVSDLRAKQDDILGLRRGFLLYNTSGAAPIRVWLPRQSRLTSALAARGVQVDDVPEIIPRPAGAGQIPGSRTPCILSALTGCLLVATVGMRLVQDIPLFRAAGTDPLAASLVAAEIVPLGVGALLGLSAVVVAWLSLDGKLQSSTPPAIVFGAIMLVGLFLAFRRYAEPVGWTFVVLSLATLVAQFWSRRPLARSGFANRR